MGEPRTIYFCLRVLLSAAGGLIINFLGGWDGLLYALVAFIVVDYVTGLAGSLYTRTASSAKGYRGIIKKVMVFVIVGVAHIVDAHLIGYGTSIVRTATILFFVSNEGLSILENACRMGLNVPPKLKAMLLQTKPGKSEVDED